MALFPPRSDLTFLLGKELARVAFEPCGVHFIWWGGGEIHAMRDFDHTDDKGTCSEFGSGNWLDPPSLLHRLIQRKVSAVELLEDSLVLKFDDGQLLRFYALKDAVENVLIQLGNELKDDYILF
ncbi:MAG: hypothetical protein J0L50_07480 [Sphingomonadales bacterium]|nr:hypothetical protein [Sphingomonadales bacterium]